MNWESLEVVAAEAPMGAGYVASRPVFRDGTSLLRVQSVETRIPLLFSRMGDEELQELYSSSVMVPLPVSPAVRGYIALVQSRPFSAAIDRAGQTDKISWAISPRFGLRVAYLPSADVITWRSRCNEALLRYAENELRRDTGGRTGDLRAAEALLQQCLFTAGKRSLGRWKTFLLLGLVYSLRDEEAAQIVCDQVQTEFGYAPERYRAALLKKRRELVESSVSNQASPAIFGASACHSAAALPSFSAS